MFKSKTKKEPDPTDVYVGSRIRLQRNLKNMTQQQLSDKIGITFQQIQKYEKGTNRVGASRLQAISEILGVPVSFFFHGSDGEKPFSEGFEAGFAEEIDGSGRPAGAEGTQLIRAFIKIRDPKVRQKIVDLALVLAEGS